MIGVAATLVVMALGSPAPDDHAVAAIVPRRMFVDDVPPQALCTAVLVTERAVLTAGHCVDDYGRGTLELHFGPGFDARTEARLVSDIVVHPRYSATSSAFDLAVLWLDAPVSLAPVPLHSGSVDVAWIDQPLRAVGFSSDERRTGDVAVEELDDDTLTYRPAPDMTCRGDSGGPILATIDGVEQLVGVTSAGDVDCVAWGVAAQVDEGVAELLALGPEVDAETIGADAICAVSCTHDEQCPNDLVCADDGQCVVRGLEAGDLVEPCTSNDDCGSGVCVALGQDARCLEPCASTSSEDLAAGGCRVAGPGNGGRRSDEGSPIWMLGVLACFARRRGCRGPHRAW